MRLLEEQGYTWIREYHGGLAEWVERGAPIEGNLAPLTLTPPAAAEPKTLRKALSGRLEALFSSFARLSFFRLFLLYLGMGLFFAVVYWLGGFWPEFALRTGGAPMPMDLDSWWSCLYFSFVTALSIGYGDVTPIGPFRLVAILQGGAGMLIFGVLISKLISQRQEELTEEIHQMAFDERLGRVRMTLHLVLADLQALEQLCEQSDIETSRLRLRLQSATAIFASSIQSVHDLLYRPQRVPRERDLQTLLAMIAGGLQELSALMNCQSTEKPVESILQASLERIRRLADQICGECIPHSFAPALQSWMDEIRALGATLLPNQERPGS